MRKIKIFKSQLALLEIDLISQQILVGRSPVCDFILRAPNVDSIHFLLEWVGEGEFNPEIGFWTLYDISSLSNKHKLTKNIAGEGVMLSEEPLSFSGFQFVLMEDRLSEASLDEGVIGRALQRQYNENLIQLGGGVVLEVARFDKMDGTLIDIVHQSRRKPGFFQPSKLPELRISWSDLSSLDIQIKSTEVVDVDSLKEPNFKFDPGSDVNMQLSKTDIFRIEFEKNEIFMRFVARALPTQIPAEFFRDPFVKYGAVFFALIMVLIFYTSKMAIHENNDAPQVSRIVKIADESPSVVASTPLPTPQAISTPRPTPVATPAPTPVPTPEPTPVATPESTPVNVEKFKSDVSRGEQKQGTSAKIKKPKKLQPKPSLNAEAKVSDVTSVGLLKKMKKSSASSSRDTSLGQLSDALADEPSNDKSDKLTLNSAQLGAGSSAKPLSGQGGKQVDLGEASSQVQSADFDSKSKGALAGGKGIANSMSFGNGNGKQDLKGLSGNGAESVSGGLTREQVKKALAAVREEVRSCFESALSVSDNLKGGVTYRFSISSEGSVSSIKVAASDLKAPLVEVCVMDVVRKIQFPKAANGKSTLVTYPFLFQKL